MELLASRAFVWGEGGAFAMKMALKLAGYVLILNVIRYVVGGPIEQFTIMEPMHRVMPLYPDVFNADFSNRDFAISLFYNYMLWFAATLAFHMMHPALSGSWLTKSFKAYGVMCLSFVSLAAVYMNHYVDAVKPFYFYSMLDAVILFALVAAANAVLYPRFFAGRPAGDKS